MKKAFLIPVLLSALLFSACSKSSMDVQAPSKVDQLLTQMKGDPLFTECLMHMHRSMNALSADISTLTYADTSIMKSKNLSYAEKAQILNLKHADGFTDEWKAASDLTITLLNKYPALAALTAEENKLFYKKAVANYLQTLKKSK